MDEDINQKFQELIESYFTENYRQKCYPGLIFKQGKRKMIQINVSAYDLPTLLQAKPSENNDPDSGKNRPEVKGHAEEVKEYLLSRSQKNQPWILGTLTANVDPSKIELIPLARGFCIVIIPRGVTLDITDGQHRKRAIHDLIESQDHELVGDNDFPITLVLESDFKQCQTDFRDMAQTRPLDKSLLLSFGEYQGRVGITKNLIESVEIFAGKTEKIKASPTTKYKLIYTTNYIAKLVGCAFSNDPLNELKDYDVAESSEALTNALNRFFSECKATKDIAETEVDYLTVEQIGEFKEKCILGRSVGIEILGRLFYCCYDKEMNYFQPDKISQLAQINWLRENQLWHDNVVRIDPNPSNPAKAYKILAGINAVRIAINKVKMHLGWI